MSSLAASGATTSTTTPSALSTPPPSPGLSFNSEPLPGWRSKNHNRHRPIRMMARKRAQQRWSALLSRIDKQMRLVTPGSLGKRRAFGAGDMQTSRGVSAGRLCACGWASVKWRQGHDVRRAGCKVGVPGAACRARRRGRRWQRRARRSRSASRDFNGDTTQSARSFVACVWLPRGGSDTGGMRRGRGGTCGQGCAERPRAGRG